MESGYHIPATKRVVLFIILLGGIALWTLINGYPFLFYDTGMYIHTGFGGHSYSQPPVYYGLFIRHFSLNKTLWVPWFFQVLITSYLIFNVLLIANQRLLTYKTVVLLTFILVFCSTVGIYASYIMPDIQVSWIPLALFLVWKEDRQLKKLMAFIVLVFASVVHFSGVVILVGTSCFLMAIIYMTHRPVWNSLKYVILSCVLSLTLVIGGNLWKYGSIPDSNNAYVYQLLQLQESGILNSFLTEKCNADPSSYPWCGAHYKLGNNIIWDSESIFSNYDGWNTGRTVFQKIIKEIENNENYRSRFYLHKVRNIFLNLSALDIIDPPILNNSSPSFYQVNERMEADRYFLKNSRQITHGFLLSALRKSIFWITIGSIIIIALTWLIKRNQISMEIHILILIVILTIVLNSIICGYFTTYSPRFNARINWLIPFLAVVVASLGFGKWNKHPVKGQK